MKSRGIVYLIHRDNIHVYWMCKRSLLMGITGSWMSTVVCDGSQTELAGGYLHTHLPREAPWCLKLCVGSLGTQWIGAFWLEYICCCCKGGKASPPTQPLRFGCSSDPCCLPLPLGFLRAASACVLYYALPILSFMGSLCLGTLCYWLGIKNRSFSANLILPWVLWFSLFYLDVRL